MSYAPDIGVTLGVDNSMLSAVVELAGDAEILAARKNPDLRAFCYVRAIEIPAPR